MFALAQICLGAAAAMLVIAALHDLAVRTVPNRLIAGLTGCALLLATLQGRLLVSGAVASLLFLVTLGLWVHGYLGGGDAKLLPACALLVAPGNVPVLLLGMALAGGGLCLPYLFGRRLVRAPAPGRPASLPARLLRCERWRLCRRGPLPYAVAIAAGTLYALVRGA